MRNPLLHAFVQARVGPAAREERLRATTVLAAAGDLQSALFWFESSLNDACSIDVDDSVLLLGAVESLAPSPPFEHTKKDDARDFVEIS